MGLTLFGLAEAVLAYAAEGALEIVGQILPLGAGGDAVVRIAGRFVVAVTAYVASIFLHGNILPIFRSAFAGR